MFVDSSNGRFRPSCTEKRLLSHAQRILSIKLSRQVERGSQWHLKSGRSRSNVLFANVSHRPILYILLHKTRNIFRTGKNRNLVKAAQSIMFKTKLGSMYNNFPIRLEGLCYRLLPNLRASLPHI